MKNYLAPILLTAAIALVGCDKKEEQKSSSAPTSTQSAPSQTTAGTTGLTSQLPAPVIAAIDVQKILNSSSATTGIRAEIERKRSEIQNEMTKYENELREREKKLAKESSSLSKEALQKKREGFEKRVADVQIKLNVRKLQLETAFEQARSKVYASFLTASDSVRKEVGANIVLYKEQVVIADNSFDITDQVLNRLNAELPTVEVTYQTEAEVLQQLQSQS